MDDNELIELNKIASANKQPTFLYKGKWEVRSEYGILKKGICCGNGCKFCVYGCIKNSTNIIKKIFDW